MRMPSKCPSCGGRMVATRMECISCGAAVEGRFVPCPVCTMDDEIRELFEIFMYARGNLKEVERELGLSYPTVRAKMERMFSRYERAAEVTTSRMDVLAMLGSGKISVDEAEELLKRSRR